MSEIEKEIGLDDLPFDAPAATATSDVAFEKYIEINSKDLATFIRLVEPLTKASIDDYGKSIFITVADDGKVVLKYYNKPYVLETAVANTGTRVKDFAITITTAKQLLSNSFTTMVFVEEKDEIHLDFSEQLVYVETKQLRPEVFDFEHKDASYMLDKDSANYCFRTVGMILNQTERASEKVIVIKDKFANFNTGSFTAGIQSPFKNDEALVIYKQVSDALATLTDVTDGDINYSVDGEKLIVQTTSYYCEFPIGIGERVNQFLCPSAQLALKFDAQIKIADEQLYSLVKLVQSLDYLSDSVRVTFIGSKMVITLSTQNNNRNFNYEFTVLEGNPETNEEMKITLALLKLFLDITGSDVKYSYTSLGLGITNEMGNFLIRKA